jgi:hypothetical protein
VVLWLFLGVLEGVWGCFYAVMAKQKNRIFFSQCINKPLELTLGKWLVFCGFKHPRHTKNTPKNRDFTAHCGKMPLANREILWYTIHGGHHPHRGHPRQHRQIKGGYQTMNRRHIPTHPGAMTPAEQTRHIIRKLYTITGAVATATAITATLTYLLFL